MLKHMKNLHNLATKYLVKFWKFNIKLKFINISTADNSNPTISDELKLVLSKQMQLKEAAFNAKKQGDMIAAKELMTLALRMNQMVF
jgi:hypothetical protein